MRTVDDGGALLYVVAAGTSSAMSFRRRRGLVMAAQTQAPASNRRRNWQNDNNRQRINAAIADFRSPRRAPRRWPPPVSSSPALASLFSRPDLQAMLFPGYCQFSKSLMAALATAASIAPFAIWDWTTVGLVVAAIATLVHRIRHRKRFLPWLSTVALTIAATAFLGTAGWALNHYAPELSRDLGLESSAQRGPADKRHRVLSGPSRQPRVTGSARGGRYSPNRTSTSSQALPECRISRSPSAMRSSREALHP